MGGNTPLEGPLASAWILVSESFSNLGFHALVVDIVNYSAKSSWKFQSKGGRVDWCKLVWEPDLHIPKHSFVSWLALPERLCVVHQER
ncbi:hypothetical protein SADUNF_Sadunf01G0113500 [Salix dunnii]|uniref:Reverse transcriptase zinc-binding domain-containing protein n=1 Tax=Salix dunnii TaxID=1413687 RepID=A0A835TMC5_9ROSI|nr:hypothetical protein SADUNF_Sadunf01G0113500 [Salix dunnii]